jgi:alkylation response protein AidB-like acyl-CoA dehydrogenase
MELELTDEQRLVRDMARDFARKELLPNAGRNDRERRYPREELRKMAELGLMGVNIPAELGGAEAGVVAYSLAMQEIAYGCASTAVTMAVTNMVGEVLCAFGTDEQKRRHVPRLTSGEYSAGAFALSEPHCGSDPASLKTRAVRDGDRWILNGEKAWITSGDTMGVAVVWARTGGRGAGGISAFLLTPDAPGFSIGRHEDKMGLRASGTVSLVLENCELPADALLGDEGGGFAIGMMALDGGRVGIASQACGIAAAALDEAKAYAKERQTFGKPIAEHQAIQFKLADMATELDAARLLALRAAWLKETKHPFSKEASMAKVFASEAANRICADAFQIHGGFGYVTEFNVERHLRDARVTTIYEGTSEIQRIVISRHVLNEIG